MSHKKVKLFTHLKLKRTIEHKIFRIAKYSMIFFAFVPEP